MSRASRAGIAIAPLLSMLAAAATAQPTITGLNSAELARSGRLVIEGSSFGTAGEVFVAGLAAWTTTWTDQRLVAFVPEAAPLGPGSVYVVVAGAQSNELPLTVTGRQRDGRVRWRFEADGSNLWWRPALGPDGTIYLHGNNETDGIVYALTPDGGLRWVQKVIWFPYVPPSTGPDGALYVGSIDRIYRISPSGQIDWQFEDPDAQGLHATPTVGPDGRLYGMFDGGMGAVALDPATGQLEWSNPGDPNLWHRGQNGIETVFGRPGPGAPLDRFFLTMAGDTEVCAFSLDGDQLFARGLANNRAHEPVVGADGTLYLPGLLDRWVLALDPTTGATLWQYNSGTSAGIERLEIGADDTLYFAYGRYLEALDPQTQSRIWRTDTGHSLGAHTLSPDGSMLVMDGVFDLGDPGFIKAFASATGEELWHVDLPGAPYPAYRVLGIDHPRFTPDGATAYLSTFTVADESPPTDPHSYLYAIDTGLGALFADGFESADTSAWSGSVP